MEQKTKISVKDLHLYYGENHALKGVNMEIRPNAVQLLSVLQAVVSLPFSRP